MIISIINIIYFIIIIIIISIIIIIITIIIIIIISISSSSSSSSMTIMSMIIITMIIRIIAIIGVSIIIVVLLDYTLGTEITHSGVGQIKHGVEYIYIYIYIYMCHIHIININIWLYVYAAYNTHIYYTYRHVYVRACSSSPPTRQTPWSPKRAGALEASVAAAWTDRLTKLVSTSSGAIRARCWRREADHDPELEASHTTIQVFRQLAECIL